MRSGSSAAGDLRRMVTDRASGTCAFCGRALDAHDLNFRFRFPDRVVALLEAGLDPSELEGDPDMDSWILLEDAAFFRVLLEVRATDGIRVTFGTWLEVDSDVLEHVARLWSAPEYMDLVVSGRLANAVPPWGGRLLGLPATATVRSPDRSPYIARSEDPLLSSVLSDEWPSTTILSALPH